MSPFESELCPSENDCSGGRSLPPRRRHPPIAGPIHSVLGETRPKLQTTIHLTLSLNCCRRDLGRAESGAEGSALWKRHLAIDKSKSDGFHEA